MGPGTFIETLTSKQVMNSNRLGRPLVSGTWHSWQPSVRQDRTQQVSWCCKRMDICFTTFCQGHSTGSCFGIGWTRSTRCSAEMSSVTRRLLPASRAKKCEWQCVLAICDQYYPSVWTSKRLSFKQAFVLGSDIYKGHRALCFKFKLGGGFPMFFKTSFPLDSIDDLISFFTGKTKVKQELVFLPISL